MGRIFRGKESLMEMHAIPNSAEDNVADYSTA
jgi:hypothetical protein